MKPAKHFTITEISHTDQTFTILSELDEKLDVFIEQGFVVLKWCVFYEFKEHLSKVIKTP